MKRQFRDRDYIETVEGLLFTVVGNVHPKDHVLSYLKNLPNPLGKWRRSRSRYSRPMRYYSARNVMKTIKFLRRTYPQYVFRSETLKLSFSAVPVQRILEHYLPEQHLAKLRATGHLDALQRKTIELTSTISEASGVSVKHFGVTGSILVNIHNVKFSDIDLVVYGRSNIPRVKDAVLRLYGTDRGNVRKLQDTYLRTWCKQQMKTHPLTMKEMRELYSKKWNRGLFKGTEYSIHPVKAEKDIKERYGDELYLPEGIIEVTGRVINSENSYFLPAIYIVDHVNSPQRVFDNVREIVSFESLYADIASRHEIVKVRGLLESVLDKSGEVTHQRIVVGSHENAQSEFMKVVCAK